MSSFAFVRLSGGVSFAEAWTALRRMPAREVVPAAFTRMRQADGFSHARSLAFLLVLLAVQGLIALVSVAGLLEGRSGTGVVVASLRLAVPGPAGETLTATVHHAEDGHLARQVLPLLLAAAAGLISATSAMAQLQRGLSRIYGIAEDRPTLHRYGHALRLTVTVGVVSLVSFVVLVFGESIGDSLANRAVNWTWAVARWPLGALLCAVAVTLLFRLCPRHPPQAPVWVAVGALVAVGLWVVTTGALSLLFQLSPAFGETYGPLAGTVALLVWSLLSSMALFFGGSVAAELESRDPEVRAAPDEPGTGHGDGRVAFSPPARATARRSPSPG